MTHERRMLQALQGAVDELMSVVGLPEDPEAEYGARVAVDEPLVDREQVPAAVWRVACYAMDVLAVGLAVLAGDEPVLSVEEGLELMTKRAGGSS